MSFLFLLSFHDGRQYNNSESRMCYIVISVDILYNFIAI